MKKLFLTFLSLITASATMITGCGSDIRSENLTENISYKNQITHDPIESDKTALLTEFSLNLFNETWNADENTLISPLSVIYALSLVSNGSDGTTRSQIEQTLGLSVDELNQYLSAYTAELPSSDKYRLHSANSIWMKDESTFDVKPEFLQTAASMYRAQIYKTSFDSDSVNDINRWVKEYTDGKIEKLIHSVSEDTVMYVLNALSFDAEWESVYQEQQVTSDVFTKEDGTEIETDFMRSSEYRYLSDESAEGFLKYYADESYAFVALLPDQNVSIRDYAASLTGSRIRDLLAGAKDLPVNAAIPKFEISSDIQLIDTLKSMGITDAFDLSRADFSRIQEIDHENIFISNAFQKCTLSVAEKGTEGGAATAIGMEKTSAPSISQEEKTVFLNRPFLYLIIDCDKKLPIFIGSVMDI